MGSGAFLHEKLLQAPPPGLRRRENGSAEPLLSRPLEDELPASVSRGMSARATWLDPWGQTVQAANPLHRSDSGDFSGCSRMGD